MATTLPPPIQTTGTGLPPPVVPTPTPSPSPTPAPGGMMGPAVTPAPSPTGFVPGSTGLTPAQVSQYNAMNAASPYAQNPDWMALSDEERAGRMSGAIAGPGPGGNVLQTYGNPDNNHPNGVYEGPYDPNFGTPSARAPMTAQQSADHYQSIATSAGMQPRGAPAPAPTGMAGIPPAPSPLANAPANPQRTAEIQGWLTAHPGATDADMRAAMVQFGVTPQEMADATGVPLAAVQQRFNAAGGTTPGATPAPAAAPVQAAPTPGNVTDDQVRAWFTEHPNATDQQIAAAMNQWQVGAGQLSRVTGVTTSEVQRRYQLATNPILPAGTPATPAGATSGFIPNLIQQLPVDATIQGRLTELLARDANGTYTSDVVRQAVDRAMQTFATRGLLNTSMAVQAGQEAAISKAIEIAGPDAQRAFEQYRANQDANNVFARDEINQSYTERNNAQQWAHQDATQANDQAFRERILTQEQSLTLRQNYVEAQDHANARYSAQVNQINASDMTPQDKSVAIQQASAVRDGDLAYNNNLFASQPGFAREWLAMAVPTAGVDVAHVNNLDTLSNIANDPAQSAEVRAAATARLQEVRAAGPSTQAVTTQAQASTYDAYQAAGGTMTQVQWNAARSVGIVAVGNAGGDANGSTSGGAPGDSAGNNANGDAAGVGAGPM